MSVIPEAFSRKMIILHGEKAHRWLERLPAVLAYSEQHWNLNLEAPFPDLSFHYVVPASRADGSRIILKVFSPTGEFRRATEALQHFDGHGMVRLLDSDTSSEIQLLECCSPGVPLSTLNGDEKATSYAAAVMQKLWRPLPPDHSFPSVLDWGAGLGRLRSYYGGGTGPFPRSLVEEAESLLTELGSSMNDLVLLHGDLHHDNILSSERESWLAIDPKGVIGEPSCETGAFLHNPQPQLLDAPYPQRLLARRVDQLAEELSLDRARICGWGVILSLLAAWWSVEDTGSPWDDALACAEMLAAIQVG